ncbi:enolase C-terminal domain-like protein [Haloarcula marina]|uniref:enolase C-terminal domain-like protein n=1 Tax=Haloarcula marina TaxID=2961574 RepID=UPI0020B66913|nr:enolase C-terminal domain-like protein [Halomicroarcula marina]
MAVTIDRIETVEFEYELPDVGTPPGGFDVIYDPGNTMTRSLFAVRISTSDGLTGEYVGSNSPGAAQINMVADYLVGRDPTARERHWSELKRALRKYDRMGIGPLDIALWDYAGKKYDAPIHELLGSYRDRFPAYASTYQGDRSGGLDSPAAYADFAEECLEMGYPGFKVHGWDGDWRDPDLLAETVRAVGERVGDEMDLMVDPACDLDTYAEALQVGRACDEYGYLWYEDPYRDGGISQHGHRKLRQALDTPILQTEHIRGLEPHTDFVATESTDFVRADPEYDGGFTGASKIAAMAEGFGLDVEFHAPGPAQRHCIAATRNANYYEMALVHPDAPNTTPPIYAGDYEDQLDAVDDDGRVPVPDGPGLGVEYDWDYIEANELGRREYR